MIFLIPPFKLGQRYLRDKNSCNLDNFFLIWVNMGSEMFLHAMYVETRSQIVKLWNVSDDITLHRR